MYGLDSFVAVPPRAALLALLLIAGCDGLGVIVLRRFGLCARDAPRWHRWQASAVGAMALAIVLYPLALARVSSFALMRTVAWAVIVIGVVHGFALMRALIEGRHTNRATNAGGGALRGWRLAVAGLLVGAAITALGPVTDADSLDYHMGVPIALLNSGGMPITPEWMHSRIAGSNDVLNALGLAAGAESFGALLQSAGLVTVAGLLMFADDTETKHGTHSRATVRAIAAVAALSAPALVALVSQKPQLLPVSMTSLGLALVIFPSRRDLSSSAALKGHALVCLLVTSASQAKLTYLLGGGVVGLLSLIVMARRGLFWSALSIALVAAVVVIAPPVIWKHQVFHDGYLNSFLRPVPGHWPGTDAFETHLRGFRDSAVPFPLSLVLPAGPSTISTIIGPAGLIVLLALRPDGDRWSWTACGAAVVVLIGSMVLGPSTSRSYFEPYFWLLMALALSPNLPLLTKARWLTWPVAAQAAFTMMLFVYGAVTLFPGALTARWRSDVMDRSANGYIVMKWADSVLPPGAVMLSGHRSMALAPREAVSLDWAATTRPGSPEAEPYLRRLKERGVTHMLVLGSPDNFMGLGGCIGPLVAGPGNDFIALRNPFSAHPHEQAWIFQFDSQDLPGCVNQRP